MSALTETDLNYIVRHIPTDVKNLCKKHNLWIGGGVIRSVITGEKISDIDIFGESVEVLTRAASDLEIMRCGIDQGFSKENRRKIVTHNAITLLTPKCIPLQFITRWPASDPISCMSSFDFTICQAIIWWTELPPLPVPESPESTVSAPAVPSQPLQPRGIWKSACNDLFYPDLAARRLNYTMPQRNEDAGGSLLRVRKFLKRGYNIQSSSLAGVVARLCMGVEGIKGHVSGEVWLAQVIHGLLLEVDPLIVSEDLDTVKDENLEA